MLCLCTSVYAYVPLFFTEILTACLLLSAVSAPVALPGVGGAALSGLFAGLLPANNVVFSLTIPVLAAGVAGGGGTAAVSAFRRRLGALKGAFAGRGSPAGRNPEQAGPRRHATGLDSSTAERTHSSSTAWPHAAAGNTAKSAGSLTLLAVFGMGLLPGLLFLLYQVWKRGAIGYEKEPGFVTPVLVGLYGYLVSPGKSVFLFSPPVLIGVAGFRGFLRRNRFLGCLALCLSAPLVLAYAKWYAWDGGNCWGPRFLIPLLPLVMLGSLPVLERFGDLSVARKSAVVFLAVSGLWVQVLAVVPPTYAWYHDANARIRFEVSDPSFAARAGSDRDRPQHAFLPFIPDYCPVWVQTRWLCAGPPPWRTRTSLRWLREGSLRSLVFWLAIMSAGVWGMVRRGRG